MTFDTTPVPVPVGDCRCPGEPHGDGDVVYLAPYLSMPAGMAAQAAIEQGMSDSILLQELLARVYLTHTILDWTFVAADGVKVPISYANATLLLPYGKGGRLVAEKADNLYAQDVLAPFEEQIARLKRSLAGSTGPKRAGSSTRRSTKTPQ